MMSDRKFLELFMGYHHLLLESFDSVSAIGPMNCAALYLDLFNLD